MKKYNPYKLKTLSVKKFRGLTDEDGKFNIPKEYVGNIINLTSQKIGEMNNREGQDEDTHYGKTVISAGRLLTSKYIQTGTEVYAESITVQPIKPVTDYDAPVIWEYPWPIIPDGEDITTLIPVPKCSDVWAINTGLTDYENAAEADTEVTEGTDACWTITCGDLWAVFPEYSVYQHTPYETTETELSGGSLSMSECWTENLNCKTLYKLYPEWDEYRTTDETFPECWDFTFDIKQMTCVEVFEQQGTPTNLQNIDGVFPDCLKDPDPVVNSKVKHRLDNFYTTPSSLSFDVEEGYTEEETATSLVLHVEGYFSKENPTKYFEMSNPNLNFTLVDVTEEFFWKDIEDGGTIISLPTRGVTAEYIVTLKEGITNE